MPWKDKVKANVITWITLVVLGAAGGYLLFQLPNQILVYAQLPNRVDVLEEKLEEKLAEVTQMSRTLTNLSSQVGLARVSQLTLTGLGALGSFGTGESFVIVNTLSDASVYADMGHMRLTNMTHPDTPTIHVEVRGTFSNRDDTILVRLSQAAARRVEISDISRVRIQPIP